MTSELVISPAHSDNEILDTRDVMCQLRPHLSIDDYEATIRRMMSSDGYRLVALRDRGLVRAVAGYRLMEMLTYGRIIKVDDLATEERFRSRGYGRSLLTWLKEEGRRHGCSELHLDSGVHRDTTHRFYFREGLTINCFHFRTAL